MSLKCERNRFCAWTRDPQLNRHCSRGCSGVGAGVRPRIAIIASATRLIRLQVLAVRKQFTASARRTPSQPLTKLISNPNREAEADPKTPNTSEQPQTTTLQGNMECGRRREIWLLAVGNLHQEQTRPYQSAFLSLTPSPSHSSSFPSPPLL